MSPPPVTEAISDGHTSAARHGAAGACRPLRWTRVPLFPSSSRWWWRSHLDRCELGLEIVALAGEARDGLRLRLCRLQL